MKSTLAAYLLVTAVCFGQIKQTGTTGEARTSGPCSPAITGSNNRIIISDCLGAKKERVEQPAFHEKEKMVEFAVGGGVAYQFTPELLRKSEHSVTFGGCTLVKLRLNGDLLIFSMELIPPNGTTQLEIKNNEFTVNMPGYDWNYTANALEIVDGQRVPVFQLVRKSQLRFVIYGCFVCRGNLFFVGPNNMQQNPTSPPGHLDLIFKYPAWKFPGKYAGGSN